MSDYMPRKQAIAEIKTALKRRSCKTWSVRGVGRIYATIVVSTPPKKRVDGLMTLDDVVELKALLGLRENYLIDLQGFSFENWSELVERANGRLVDGPSVP